jgi:DNA repair protein RadC
MPGLPLSEGGDAVLPKPDASRLPLEMSLLSNALAGRGRRRKSDGLVSHLASRYGSLAGILSAPEHVLSEDPRVGPIVARNIAALKRTMVEAAFAPLLARPVLDDEGAVIAYLQWASGREPIEEARILYLDAKHAVTSDGVLAYGTGCGVIFSPVAVARSAVRIGAAGVILAHNHPSGDERPSDLDVEVTRGIEASCAGVGVRLVDHIIVAHGRWFSFRRNGILLRIPPAV